MNDDRLAYLGAGFIALGVLWTGILWALYTPMYALTGVVLFSVGVLLIAATATTDARDDGYRFDP